MAGGGPKIKFSPFEALLIGEKNKVVKRQPLRNTIYVTRLNKVRRSFNLRELFDVKSNAPRSRNKSKKTEKRKDVYCFEFEGRKLIVKGNEFVEFKLNNKKNEKQNRVKFRPDFKFKETLEEKIVSKIQSRRLRNKCVIPNLLEDRRNVNKRKRLNAREEKINLGKRAKSIYLQRIYDKKQERCNLNNNIVDRSESDEECKIVKVTSPCLNNRVAKKFCDNNYTSPEIKLPPYPKRLKPSDYEKNENLIEILIELKEPELFNPSDNLRVYSKKKSISTDIEVVYDSRLESKNKFLNGRKTVQVPVKPRRNGFNSRIDEPLNIDDHLIEGTNLGTLFFNTSNGDDIFLGNFVRPLLFDSPFGSLPSV